ncbi:MAG: TolC family protein [Bacteriovoracaceae bacterium]
MALMLMFLTCSHLFADTLRIDDVYRTAISNTEVMKRSQARLDQAEERKNQASGAIMPAVSLKANYLEIEPPKAAGGVSNAFTRTNQYSTSINVTQPLFRGLRDFALYRQTKSTVLLNQYLKDYSKITLYQSVIAAYYNLLMAQKDLESIRQLKKYSEERTRELRERVKIGRSRKGELLQSESQGANALAAEVDAESLVVESRASLAFFLNDKTSTEYVLAPEVLPTDLKPMDYYVSLAQDRPDLKAKMTEVEVSTENISLARGNHLPNLDLFGNYYLARTGILATSNWDVGVTLTMPLFQGGVVNAQVREAVEKKNEIILNHDETKRMIERDVTVLYESVSRSLKQLDDLKKAMKKTEETYRESQRDYRFGLVNNLDVILSLNSYVETKRSYDRLETQTIMSYKNLEAVAGVLP